MPGQRRVGQLVVYELVTALPVLPQNGRKHFEICRRLSPLPTRGSCCRHDDVFLFLLHITPYFYSGQISAIDRGRHLIYRPPAKKKKKTLYRACRSVCTHVLCSTMTAAVGCINDVDRFIALPRTHAQ